MYGKLKVKAIPKDLSTNLIIFKTPNLFKEQNKNLKNQIIYYASKKVIPMLPIKNKNKN